ncbi:hypothetical protein GCM10007989_10010 [Devosia pacifica]|uniref:SH3b domain-containing protein n=1 Tax=Devosia pacifica TaxID=1335967 RepID=A0A918S1P1_9HYPH|nr:SH3 domain-containing protein [Devosia pacifica]GHA16834.1 hypothetical protein GCM10007989_10010 [Devosia pacifica]
MRRQTRKMLLNLFTGMAVAATAAVVFLPAAQAAPATASANVNVRSGPGGSYGVVDVLQRGQRVEVDRCQGSWCYVVKPGPDGWVSSNYLGGVGGGSTGGSSSGSGPSINFGFSIGPDGPDVQIGTGRPAPRVTEVCFYDRTNYRGEEFCLEPGERARLPRYSDGVASIDNPDGYRVEVCAAPGDCRTYTTSASSLGRFGDYVESVRVR